MGRVKLEDLSPTSRSHIIEDRHGNVFVIPMLGRWRQVDLWGSLAASAAYMGSFQPTTDPVSKTKQSKKQNLKKE